MKKIYGLGEIEQECGQVKKKNQIPHQNYWQKYEIEKKALDRILHY